MGGAVPGMTRRDRLLFLLAVLVIFAIVVAMGVR